MEYILISIGLIGAILAVFATALYVRSRYTKSYEKKFQEAFKADTDNEPDKAIKKYLDVIKDARELNPILINTYLLLAEAYHEKGSENDPNALKSIDEAIALVQNNKVNREEAYVKGALFYKADFLGKIHMKKEAEEMLNEIKSKYKNDPVLQKKIDRRLTELANQG